jgi:ribonuclease-3
VSRRSCVEVAGSLDVANRIRDAAPEGYEDQADRLVASGSVLAEALEAGIGACLLEFGFETTADAVAGAFHEQIEFAVANQSDFKSELQERLAQRGEFVVYRVVKEEGPPHDRLFETVAEVDGRPLGSGTGKSKKESEQEAARRALEQIEQSE